MVVSRTQTQSAFPQIDADPHFKRVVKYFRPSDYAVWGTATAAFPASLYALEHLDPTQAPKVAMRAAGRLGFFLGACGGFLMAYQRSSQRFWGWEENAREVAMAKEEGIDWSNLPSALEPHMQGIAYRNSVFSQLKFSALPWFNFVNHPHHGPGLSETEGGDEE